MRVFTDGDPREFKRSVRLRLARSWALLGTLCLVSLGCGVMDQMTGAETASRRISAQRARENERREAFLTSGDTRAIRWLLAHGVREGMKVDEVGRILGQPGEREFADHFIKSGPGHFLVDDEAYRWGPDDHGRSYFLVFREGKLINFDPSSYEGGEAEE